MITTNRAQSQRSAEAWPIRALARCTLDDAGTQTTFDSLPPLVQNYAAAGRRHGSLRNLKTLSPAARTPAAR